MGVYCDICMLNFFKFLSLIKNFKIKFGKLIETYCIVLFDKYLLNFKDSSSLYDFMIFNYQKFIEFFKVKQKLYFRVKIPSNSS